jgi:hypothetical protein
MAKGRGQVLRFAVGSARGARSRTFRLWTEPGKSDVYIAGRRMGSSVKVSLHEPGPARFAYTREYARHPDAIVKEHERAIREWERPRPVFPGNPMVRPFAIIVPWNEVIDRGNPEHGDVTWTPQPPDRSCVAFGVQHLALGDIGSRSVDVNLPAGVDLVGQVRLADGTIVIVTAHVEELSPHNLKVIEMVRGARALDADGNRVRLSVLLFGVEPDGMGKFMDVTPPWDKGSGPPVGLKTD